MNRSAPAAPDVAGIGARIGAFLVDSAVCVAVALAAGFRPGQPAYGVAVAAFFLALEFVGVALAGQTPGMRALGIAVARLAGAERPGLGAAAIRTVLLAFVLPALLVDTTGRGMHDRAAGTVTVRTR